jgi:hypothetical protein
MAGSVERLESSKQLEHLVPSEVEMIWNSLYAGRSIKQTALKLGYTFQALSNWLYEPARLIHLNRARQLLASQLAHETLAIADSGHSIPGENWRETANPDDPKTFPTQPDAARDKLRIQARQWLASKWDKDTYASSPSTVINVDAKSLHIDSLRKSSTDLQTTGRLLEQQRTLLPPVDLTGTTALQNAVRALTTPPASPSTPPSGDGGTPSRDETTERNTVVSSRGKAVSGNVGTTAIEYRPEDRAD